MNFEYYIAKRIAPGRTETFAKPVVRIAILSIALGLALILASVAIVIGFKHSISHKMLGFAAPIQVIPFDQNKSMEESPLTVQASFLKKLKANPDINHIQFVAQKAGVLKTKYQMQGIILKGVDAAYDWTFLRKNLNAGQLPDFKTKEASRDVLISKKLANKLLLKVGDPVRIWFVSGQHAGALGRKLLVAGIYSTGIDEFDSRFVICDLRQIQALNGWNPHQVGSIELEVKDLTHVRIVAQRIYKSIPYNLNIQTVYDKYPEVFSWLSLLDTNVVVILVLMLIVAGITMISTLFILIIERTGMVGILKTLGANNNSIRKIFLYKATYIILWGMFWGNLLGIGFYSIQYYFHLFKLNAQNYYVSYVPVELHWPGFLLINTGVFLLSILMLILPSFYITRITPSRALRYE